MGASMLTLMGASGGYGFATIILVILFCILAVTAIHVYYKSQESYKLGLQIPGPDPIPIMGNALMAVGKTPNGKHFLISYALFVCSFIKC